MLSTTLVVAGALAVGVAAARMFNEWHARKAASRSKPHARTANGIIAGAEAIWLNAGNDRAVLLLHGFNDTPQSVAEFGRALHARGWSVSVPLLPAHGRDAETLAREGSADAWIACARSEWAAIRGRYRHAVLIGQSMGGALATIVAAENEPAALVLLAPYLSMGRLTRLLASIWPVWQIVVPKLVSDPQKGIRDPAARGQTLGGGEFTPRLVGQLLSVVVAARRALGLITAPALVLHAKADYRIPSANAKRAFGLLGSPDKTLIWRENAGHVLTADTGREEISRLVGEWLEGKVPREAKG